MGEVGQGDDGAVRPGWALDLLNETRSAVPAYESFLRAEGLDPSREFSWDDWSTIPIMTKSDYLMGSPIEDLLNGGLGSIEMVSSSSGSSGEPFFWPRAEQAEFESATGYRRIVDDYFGASNHRTLVIIAFSMGLWIAGSYTLEGVRQLARSNPNVSVITPGINIEDNLQVLQRLAPQFDRVVLAGYPPLVFDILTMAKASGVDLASMDARLLVAGENISEAWRDKAMKLIAAADPLASVVSIYGTADAGIIGHETPGTIALRRLASDHCELASWSSPVS